ncbi:MAG TPA: L-threonylcarbamoyladenylate synthase [Chitinophagaceae bacterium]|nr:L-threonylcarbamoyladenylate synthase [Chitinophagaceae bacterium]
MDFSTDIEKCVEVIKAGGLILYPTDTIWGIGCDATNEQAIDKIYQLKNRPASKSMIILVAEERDVLQYVASPDLRLFDYLQTVERPTTVIYESAVGLPSNIINEDGSIAIRITQDPFCRHLIKRLRKPIVSTSANFSGQKSPAKFSMIPEEIINGVDYVVKYRQDDQEEISASHIIRWENGAVVTIR